MTLLRRTAIAILGASAALGAHAASVQVTPVLPSHGQAVTVELKDVPTYLPVSRYVKSGNTIVVEFEYAPSSFGPFSPDFGISTVSLGELAPGNYTIQARLFNLASPKSAPEVVNRQLAVVPPETWGLHLVPKEPDAFSPFEVVVRSAVYFDPASMRARIENGVVRVDFDYLGTAPAGGNAPAGMATFGAVAVPALQPGTYRGEGWGRDRNTGVTER